MQKRQENKPKRYKIGRELYSYIYNARGRSLFAIVPIRNDTPKLLREHMSYGMFSLASRRRCCENFRQSGRCPYRRRVVQSLARQAMR